MSSSKVNKLSRNSKGSARANSKQSKSQQEVIDLTSDNENNVIDLISDDEDAIPKKPATKHSQKANNKSALAMSPARPVASRKHLYNAEHARQEDLAARRKVKEAKELAARRRRLLESQYESEDDGADSPDEFKLTAAEKARQDMMETAKNHLQAMWTQHDADNHRGY